MHGQSLSNEYLTLMEATRITPGRPSPNCIWRWCRRGVVSRSGERVRLQHVRIGGKIFTSTTWLEEFGRKLAEADSKYFELAEKAAAVAAAQTPPRRRRVGSAAVHERRRREIEEANRELEEAGL